jgi:hypothetical protein
VRSACVRRTAAVERNIGDVDAGFELEQLHCQLRRGAIAGTCIIELARLGLGAGDDFGERSNGGLGIHRQNIRRHRQRGNWSEVLGRIVSAVFIERRVHQQRAGREEKRVAVRFGARGLHHADIGAGAGAVFHDHGLAKRLLQRRLQKPRQHVGGARRRKRHNDADRPRGVKLRAPPLHRPRWRGMNGEARSACPLPP